MEKNIIDMLLEKALYVRKETLKLHLLSPETRIASSLSAIEIYTVLYYGGILKYDSSDPEWQGRDRLIVSKGHGAISLYPIFADLKFFHKNELGRIGQPGALLKAIPDCLIPGFESINGALGNGLGEGCGISLALKAKKLAAKVFVISGDGELNEGSTWESVMFAGHHKLNNLNLIIDSNKLSMLGYCRKILDLEPLEDKFGVFGWQVDTADGHDIQNLFMKLRQMKDSTNNKPKVLIANTIKGKGIPELEKDPLCHIRSLSADRVRHILKTLK